MFDAKSMIEYGGLLLVFLSIYSQIGLFFCFFIPSGALMFATGALIASDGLDYSLTSAGVMLTVASVLGNLTGYFLGLRAGHLLQNRPDSRFFKKQHISAAERFYEKHGGRALSFGIFLPIVRTFAPIVAGMVRLRFRRFMLYVIVGSASWVFSFLFAGYLIGSRPYFRPYLNYMVVGIVIVVSIPVVMRLINGIKKQL